MASGSTFEVLGTAAVTGLLWCLAVPLFYEYPHPWPDEVLFADAASSLIESGKMATTVWSGLLPGTAERSYWMPPLYFLFLAAWFAAFGPSFEIIRISTLLTAGAVLFAIRASVRLLVPAAAPLAVVAGVAVVAMDPLFVRAAIVGRSEMLTLLFSLAAVLVLGGRPGVWRATAAGALAGGAALSHPIGLAAPVGIALWLMIVTFSRSGPRPRVAAAFVGAWTLAILPWLLYIAADVPSFDAQFSAQLDRKSFDTGWQRLRLFVTNLGPDLPSRVTRIAAFGLGLAGLLGAARRAPDSRPLALTGVGLVAVGIWGREPWYPFYLVPFGVLGLLVLVSRGGRLERTAVALLLALVVSSGVGLFNALGWARSQSYALWTTEMERALIARLPAGATVLVNSLPDPALAFLWSRRDLRWREFPPVPVDPVHYAAWMEEVDVFLLGRITPDRGSVRWVMDRRPDWPRLPISAGNLDLVAVVRPSVAEAAGLPQEVPEGRDWRINAAPATAPATDGARPDPAVEE